MSSSGYIGALEAAGATVHANDSFGDYQGTWIAKVTLSDGRTGFITGSYGSCSGCDAFEAEFDYASERCEQHRWNWEEAKSCSKCEEQVGTYQKRLAEFGAAYLDGLVPSETALEAYKKQSEWDLEADEIVKFIKEHSN